MKNIKNVPLVTLVAALLMIITESVAQTADNLSFSSNDFTGWTMSIGSYLYNTDHTDLVYYWTDDKESSCERFKLINDAVNADDPIVACSSFVQKPFTDGAMTLRIGVPTTTKNMEGAEGSQTMSAAAERAQYTFTVTEETQVMIMNFASVLRIPSARGTTKNPTGDLVPYFGVNINFSDENGQSQSIGCSTFETNDPNSKKYLKNNGFCNDSKAISTTGAKASEDYMYLPWTSTVYDLRDKVGWTVTLNVIVHDEVSTANEAYGYIYAKTSKLELQTNNCVSSGEDPTIFAPEGFDSYTWYLNGAESTIFTKTNESGSKVKIDRSKMSDGDEYSCEMRGKLETCDPIVLKTKLEPVQVKPDILYTVDCSGTIHFKNNSSVVGDDELFGYAWSFADSSSSVLENPTHTYKKPGDYKVKLAGTTKLGCQGTDSFDVTVPFFPTTIIEAKDTVCSGKSIEFNAGNIDAASTVTWLDSTKSVIGNGVTHTEVIDNSGWYYVSCVDKMNCGYQDSVYINVVTSPKIYLSASKDTICEGDSTILKASSLVTCKYKWGNDEEGMTTKVYPMSTSIYKCTATSLSFGCETSEEIKIVVAGSPVISIEAPTEVCEGETAVLKGKGGVSYEWNTGTNSEGEEIYYTADSITIVPEEGQTYSVIGIDSRKCAGTSSTSIAIKKKPDVTISGISQACRGEKVTITASGADSYVWNDSSTGDSYTATIEGTLAKVVVVGTTNGCSTEKRTTLDVLPAPVLWIEGDSTICPDDYCMITVHGADTYQWNDGSTSSLLSVSPDTDTKYTVVGTGENGCKSSTEVTIRLRENPTIKINGDFTTCRDSMVQITASGATEYTWDIGKQGESVKFVVPASMSVNVIGTDEYGCRGEAGVMINPVQPPVLSYSGKTVACMGNVISLTGIGGDSYEWYYNGNIDKGNTLDFYPETDTYVRLVGSLQNCNSEIYIYVHPTAGPNVLVQGDRIICPGNTFEIRASGAESYKWSTNETTDKISYSISEKTTYSVTGTDENGCSGTSTYTVDVYPNPTPKIESNTEQGCAGEGDFVDLKAQGGIYYEWRTEPTIDGIDEQRNSESIKANIYENTKFYLYCRDENGCEAETSKSIMMSGRNTFEFDVSPGWIDASNPTVSFSGISPKDAEWRWTPHATAPEIKGRTAIYTYDVDLLGDSVSVLVHVVDDNGCVYNGEAALYVWKDFWAPNAFSPNEDDKNEFFHFYGGRFVEEFSFIIYDRLGQVVFEGDNFESRWNGTKNGVKCPWGVYGWVCKYKCIFNDQIKEGQQRGFVTLVR